MIANILPAETPWTQGVGSKHFFFEESPVAYQIKGDGL